MSADSGKAWLKNAMASNWTSVCGFCEKPQTVGSYQCPWHISKGRDGADVAAPLKVFACKECDMKLADSLDVGLLRRAELQPGIFAKTDAKPKEPETWTCWLCERRVPLAEVRPINHVGGVTTAACQPCIAAMIPLRDDERTIYAGMFKPQPAPESVADADFKCIYCGNSYSKESILNTHIKHMHKPRVIGTEEVAKDTRIMELTKQRDEARSAVRSMQAGSAMSDEPIEVGEGDDSFELAIGGNSMGWWTLSDKSDTITTLPWSDWLALARKILEQSGDFVIAPGSLTPSGDLARACKIVAANGENVSRWRTDSGVYEITVKKIEDAP